MRGLRGRLSGCEVECFGMGAAVVPGQDLGEGAGPVRDGALADLAAGDRQMGDGHGEAVAAACSFVSMMPGPRSDLARCSRRTHTSRQKSEPMGLY